MLVEWGPGSPIRSVSFVTRPGQRAVTDVQLRVAHSYDAAMPTTPRGPKTETRRGSTAVRRRARQSAILAATRTLFDQRGVAEAQIEDIARAVGINRAIVYRHFTGKEELFALALVGYLEELEAALDDAAGSATGPHEQLAAIVSAFVDYGVAHPAFVDCAHSLMRRTGTELFDEISEGAMLRLGRAIASCLTVLRRPLAAGADSGEFRADDPALLANTLYATGLGGLQLARVGLVIDEAAPGVPKVGSVGADQVKSLLLTSALGMAQG
jgi:AcrR family transcriptional regulator